MSISEAEIPTPWFWVMTIQWEAKYGGVKTSTSDGHYVPIPPLTRREIYKGVTAEARRLAGVPEDASAAVLFYSIEPNGADTGGRP